MRKIVKTRLRAILIQKICFCPYLMVTMKTDYWVTSNLLS